MASSDEFDFDDSNFDWQSIDPDALTQRAPPLPALPPPAPPRPPRLAQPPPQPLPRASQVPPRHPPPPPPLSQHPYGTARPNKILRPAQPPARKKPRLSPPPPPALVPVAAPRPPPAPVSVQRPPPPQQQQKPPPSAAALAAAERQKSRDGQGNPAFVDPNPWAGSPAVSPAKRSAPGRQRGRGMEEREEEEEDLPAIQVDESGRGYRAEPQRGVTVAVSRAAPVQQQGVVKPVQQQQQRAVSRAPSVAPAVVPLQPQPQPVAQASVSGEAGGEGAEGGGTGMSEKERKELADLRKEKAQLQSALAASRLSSTQLQQQVATKLGENKIVRIKLGRAEAAHRAAMEQERRDRNELVKRLEEKEREVKMAVERNKVEDAFRRQEEATSASRHRSYTSHSRRQQVGTGAPGFSSSTSQRFYAHAPSPSAVAPHSPSVGRSGRAQTERPGGRGRGAPRIAQPNFGAGGSGFNPSATKLEGREGAAGFAPSQGRKGLEREGSMGPPKTLGGGVGKKGEKGGRKEGAVQEKGKGKGRQVQLVEDESFFGSGTGAGGEEEGYGGGMDVEMNDGRGAEAEEEEERRPQWDWDWVVDERDTDAELLTAVFSHTTLSPIDGEAAGSAPALPHQHPHAHSHSHRLSSTVASSARPSFGASTGTTTPSARYSHFTHHASTSTSTFPSSAALSRALHTSTSTSSTPIPSTPPPSDGPFPTLHALLNLRFPPSTPLSLVQHYDLTSRRLFTLLGRAAPAHLHPHPPAQAGEGEEDLPTSLATHLTSLLLTLERARLTSAMTALLRLVASLVFLSKEFGRACGGVRGEVPVVVAASGGGVEKDGTAPKKGGKEAMEKMELLPLLARIIARYGRPEPPSSFLSSSTHPHSHSHSRLGSTPSSAVAFSSHSHPSHHLDRTSSLVVPLRSRKARIVRPSLPPSHSSKKLQADGEESLDRVVGMERGRRERLMEAAVGVVEGLGWRGAVEGTREGGGGGVGELEEGLMAFVQHPCTVATLLDPNQPLGLLLSGVRVLTLLACRPALFRPLSGTKFYDAPDTRNGTLPLVDRIATLLVTPRVESAASHTLDLSLFSLSLRLLTAHEDALRLITSGGSPLFVPSLLSKLWTDVRTLWEWDGRDLVGSKEGDALRRGTERVARALRTLYYLLCAPQSALTIGDLLTGSSAGSAAGGGGGPGGAGGSGAGGGGAGGGGGGGGRSAGQSYQQLQAVHDSFNAAIGTLAIATLGAGSVGEGEDGEGSSMPSWTAERGFEKERTTLIELGYLAQEILEDVSPLELEEIEMCFGPPEDEEEDEEEEENEQGAEGRAGGEEEERMLVDAEEGERERSRSQNRSGEERVEESQP